MSPHWAKPPDGGLVQLPRKQVIKTILINAALTAVIFAVITLGITLKLAVAGAFN